MPLIHGDRGNSSRIGGETCAATLKSAAPEREPVRTLAELLTLDSAEVLEGYRDGLNHEPEPGNNRSKAYWHGWRNGRNDRDGVSDEAGRALAREYLAASKLRDEPIRGDKSRDLKKPSAPHV